jgi:hypothetical protein
LRFARKRDLPETPRSCFVALFHCGSPAIMTGWAGSTGER